jgi:hypothetical protein
MIFISIYFIWNGNSSNNRFIGGNDMELQKDDYFGLFFPAFSEITEKGIRFGGNYYSCQMAIRKQWFYSTSSNRVLKVFVDTLNDNYLLIRLEDGCLAVAHKIENHQITSDEKVNDYYDLINRLKILIKERKRNKK